jgi:small subunit ribosomal protein S1
MSEQTDSTQQSSSDTDLEQLAGDSSAVVAVDPDEVDKAPPRVGISPELSMDPYGDEDLDISRDDFAALLEDFEDDLQDVREGEIVKARVLKVTDASVILEFGFKSEGSVALDEFKDPESLAEGDEVEVLLESLEDDDGIVVLSKRKADFLRVWEKIREAHEADRPVKGTLARKIKGGVTVDLMGVDAFLPGSQIALRRVPNIEDLIGETYKFKIIKLNKRRRNIVVSRRVILEAERERKRDLLVKELLVGQVREGTVKNITDFGAFIDLGGLDGLLHITDMSWGRVGHPSEVVDIGERLDIKVLDIDWDRERISLGLKQLLPYPWTDIDKKYPVGSRVRGKVVSITNYGAFVELEKGVEGLVHISEMSWTRNIRHPSKLVSIGDEIEAVVLKVDPDDEKISLGMKQIEEDPWLSLPMKYPSGTRITGKVRNLTSFGAFVEIEPGIDGLVHVSDMSWTRRVEHPSEIVQKGQDLEVLILDIDAENKRISLGIKQLEDDPWPGIAQRFAPGVEWEGKVARVQDKGVVVDLGDDIEGFVPASHSAVENVDRLDEYYREGDPVDLKVLESDAANRRIVLEVVTAPERRAPAEEPDEAVEEPSEEESTAAAETDAEQEAEAETEEGPSGEAAEEATVETDEGPSGEAAEEATVAAEEPDEEATVDAGAGDEAPAAESDEGVTDEEKKSGGEEG